MDPDKRHCQKLLYRQKIMHDLMWFVLFLILCTSPVLPKTVRRIFLCFPSVVMITACWSEGRICTASHFYWTWEGDTSAAARITKLTFSTMVGTFSMENIFNHGLNIFHGKLFQPWMEHFPYNISFCIKRNFWCIAHGSIVPALNF